MNSSATVGFDSGFQPVWSVRHSGRHRYHWTVNYRGRGDSAFLTYGLVRTRGSYRGILAVEVSHSEHARAWLDEENFKCLSHLESLLSEKRKSGLGKTGAAKALALDIYSGELLLPQVDVAVHKFGAVPIYVIPNAAVSLEILGQQLDCEIGIFVSGLHAKDAEEDTEDRSREPVNSLFLVRSLRIRPELQFKRYMEDVGEYAYDLRTKSNWSSVFRYGRKIEELLNASVRSKIKTVLTNAVPNKRSGSSKVRLTLHREARQYLGDFPVLLCKFFTARVIYLFILNHLYRAVGMRDICEHYDREYTGCWDKFFSSPAVRDKVREEDPELGALTAIWNAWHSADPQRELAVLQRDFSDLEHWLQRLIDFACFTSSVHQLKVNPETTKVFFSGRHIPSMRHLKGDVARLFKRQFGELAVVLHVESDRPGFPFADQIPPQIWISDAFLSVYSPRNELSPKDRDWIGYEVVLAKSFRLPDMITRESLVTLDEVYKRLSKNSIDWANQLVNSETIPALPDDSSERIQFLEPYLLEMVREAMKKKCETLLRAFLLNFFTEEQVWTIAKIHLSCLKLTKSLRQIEGGSGIDGIRIPELAVDLKVDAQPLRKRLSEIGRSERALSFATLGAEIPPLVIDPQQQYCKANLLAAMEILRPDLLGSEVGEQERRNHLIDIMKTLI